MSDQTKKPVYINRENFTDKIKSYLRVSKQVEQLPEGK